MHATSGLKTFDVPPPLSETTRGLNTVFALAGAADATVLPFMALYLFERGFGPSAIGIVLAAAALASFVVTPVWAYLADRRLGAERTVVVVTVAAAAAAVLLGTAKGLEPIAAATVGLWVARAPLNSLLDAIALQRLGTAGRSGYARIRSRMSAGWVVSVLAAGAVFQAAGLRLAPFLYAPLLIVVGFWVWRFLEPAPRNAPVQSTPALARAAALPMVPLALLGFLVSSLLVGAAFAATNNFVTLRINVLGGGVLLIGAASAFQALTEVPTMAYAHVVMRYLSHRLVFVVGCGIYVAVFVVWAFTSDALVTALIKLVMGVGFALCYVASVVIADDLAPAHLRATAQALVKAVSFGLAPVVGALAGGIVYGAIGSRAMFLAAAVVTVVAAIVALMALPARDQPNQHTVSDISGVPANAPE
jgi:PPP family 3-phenylpropionic acid transporter